MEPAVKYLKKLHERRTPSGLEIVILRQLPKVLMLGTLALLVVAMSTRLFPPDGTAAEVAKKVKFVDIFSIAAGITLWTALFTVAIGCVVVMIMKGPAYVADAYPVSHASRPAPDDDTGQ